MEVNSNEEKVRDLLSDLDSYVYYMVNHKEKISQQITQVASWDYDPPTNDYLEDALLHYRQEALPILEKYLQQLNFITEEEIKESVSLVDLELGKGWYSFSVEEAEKKRKKDLQLILNEKLDVQKFILGIIERFKKMDSTPNIPTSNTLETINTEENTSKHKINTIFKYLKDNDYMSEEEYNRLLTYLCDFMDNNFEVPSITPKFKMPKNEKKLPLGTLYHLFYKLYYDFGVRGSQNSFSEFIKSAFRGFENRKIEHISKRLTANSQI